MAGEMSDKDSQSNIYTLLMVSQPIEQPPSAKSAEQIAHRMGQIVGQLISGFLAHPERHWPKLFAGEFWAKYPFSLPCFVGAGFALCAVAYAAIVIKGVGLPLIPTISSLSDISSRPLHQNPSPPPIRVVVDESEPFIQPNSKTLGSTLRSVLTWPIFSMLLNHATMVLLGEQT